MNAEEPKPKHAGGRPKRPVRLDNDADRLAITFIHAFVTYKELHEAMGLIDGNGSVQPRDIPHRAARVWCDLIDMNMEKGQRLPTVGEDNAGNVWIDRRKQRPGDTKYTKILKDKIHVKNNRISTRQPRADIERLTLKYKRYNNSHPDADKLSTEGQWLAALIASIYELPTLSAQEHLNLFRALYIRRLVEAGIPVHRLANLVNRITIQWVDTFRGQRGLLVSQKKEKLSDPS